MVLRESDIPRRLLWRTKCLSQLDLVNENEYLLFTRFFGTRKTSFRILDKMQHMLSKCCV